MLAEDNFGEDAAKKTEIMEDTTMFKYYKNSFEGRVGPGRDLSKYLAGNIDEAGLANVTLKLDENESVDVSTLVVAKKAKESEDAPADEAWVNRQRVFDSTAWHHVRGWAPNSKECIRISTRASIREMLLPGVYAIFFPVFIGFLVGARMLMGVLAGSVGSGAMLAIMMSNAGGAWDNSKKYIEIAKAHGGKGTGIHKACVVGDTVGDPFKDTSGPALNILLKLMAMVSLTIATLLRGQDDWEIGWWAFIPGAIMLFFTYIYCKYIYNETESGSGVSADAALTYDELIAKEVKGIKDSTELEAKKQSFFFQQAKKELQDEYNNSQV